MDNVYIEGAFRGAVCLGVALIVFALLGVLLSGVRDALAVIATELQLLRRQQGEQFRILQEEKRQRAAGPQKQQPPVLDDDGIAPETWRLIERLQGQGTRKQ